MKILNRYAKNEKHMVNLAVYMYAIIDIETTGGRPKAEKIIEIAIFIFDGEHIVNEFVSLINPERNIPYFITKLTGITNEMVENAPKFYEIAKQIIEITENTIFVAHNSFFDYSFIKEEFKSLGYTFKREQLCTVKLSRKLLPGHESYGLGNLCKDLNIHINGRHRAAGDALATTKLFELLLEKSENKQFSTKLNKLKGLNKSIKKEFLINIPETTGVYYFYDSSGEIIYIGKSKNIYKRILTHLGATITGKASEMKSKIADISYEETGSELIALLYESAEIKKNMPIYNRRQRRSIFHWGVYSFFDEKGYLNFKIEKNSDTESIPINCYSSNKQAKESLFALAEKHQLCQKLCGLYESAGACFGYHINECKGACIGIEEVMSYNSRAKELINAFDYKHNSFYVVEEGPEEDLLGFVKVANGKYIGFGYISKNEASNIELINDCIKIYEDNRDTQQIIRNYLKTNKTHKLLVI